MTTRILLLASAATLSLTGCASSDAKTASSPTQQKSASDDVTVKIQSEGERLRELFAASDEASLKRNPLTALFRGDMRYAGQFGDYITDAYMDGERAAAKSDLDALMQIDRSKLGSVDAIAYDVFKRNTENTLKGLTPEILALTNPRPINHFSGFHTFYPTFANGSSGAPFNTLEDYENNLKRHSGFVTLLDRSIGRFREGMTSGVVETKLTINNVIEQLATQLALPTEESAFYGPIKKFPEGIDEAKQAELAARYKTVIENDIYPAYQRLHDFLKNEYLPVAREEVGLSSMKGGDTMYRFLIEGTTTLPLDPAEVHELGLSEVARIKGEMEGIKKEVGFDGTLAEFFTFIRTDPQFHPESREALTQGYYDIGKQVDKVIDTQFKVLPKSPLEIRPYDKSIEKFQAGGSYSSGTADGSRPGIFYFNAYDLPSRNTSGMTTLYLHEGAPGHHFQISLAQENDALPNFMRYGGNTAYVEGWALYSEKLGFPMGLFKDPYQRFGHLDDEMLRAMRLVVDTGLHSKAWSREKAIKYMLDNSSMGETDATAEVERYIAIPSQALAYKIGALTIQRLKDRAKTRLGPRFDPREFHDEVLNTGALPMTVLESKIDRWIDGKLRMMQQPGG
ncbi:DUF885 domain-containing protein [Sphingorhabdus sp. Alg239-R122]|uniref:DUF885 domain-containing protein n=1 Tax=Sphingorhabdus sp. Alg239-R122 TaxID=2305989 RepID=UPI0013DD339D|nr:DUF885 domain-containing protein [Sphingorhabdus sp. Alg239-R122]